MNADKAVQSLILANLIGNRSKYLDLCEKIQGALIEPQEALSDFEIQ